MYKFLSKRIMKDCKLGIFYIDNKLYKIDLLDNKGDIIRIFDNWKECYNYLKRRIKYERI